MKQMFLKQKSLLLIKFLSAILIFFLNINMAFNQINLVNNPSFELISSCPSSGDQIYLAISWDTPIGGGGGNPELFHECCTEPFICGVPLNSGFTSFQYAQSGVAYAGIDAILSWHGNNWREYIQSKLLTGLTANNSYCVKFYVSLSDQSRAYITHLGAYFDDGSVTPTLPNGIANVIPQVVNTVQVLNDTINWMKIESSFKATGNEEYITIGNFYSISESGIGFFGNPSYWGAYYYIDDVSVIDVSLPAYAGNDTLIQHGDSIFIGRQPEIGLDEDCIWFVNGQPIDTVAGLWVWPDSTTTYIVQQTICGNVTWDTVTVSVDTGVGMAAFELNKRFNVYPNPATHQLTIESPVTNATLCITNLLGQEVWRQEVREKSFSVDVSRFGKGVYFVYMKTEKGVIVKKFMKE